MILRAVNMWDSIPAELYDGNTYAWYNFVNNITKDGSNLISQAEDISGNGRHLLQETNDYKPLWSLEGATFDGINDYMRATGWNLAKPTTVYVVMKKLNYLINQVYFDGLTNNQILFKTYAPQRPMIQSGSGNIIMPSFQQPSNIYCLKFDGANSFIRMGAVKENGTTGSVTATGFTLGATADLGAFSNLIFKEIIIRSVSDSVDTEYVIMNSLMSRY